MVNFKAIVTRKTLSVETTYKHNEFCKGAPVVVDIVLNTHGQYSPVLAAGRVWQSSLVSALAAASFVLGRPAIKGKTVLVD